MDMTQPKVDLISLQYNSAEKMDMSQPKVDMINNIEYCLVCGDRGRMWRRKLFLVINFSFFSQRVEGIMELCLVKDVKDSSRDLSGSNSVISAGNFF